MPIARGSNQSPKIVAQRGHYYFGAPKVENVPYLDVQPPVQPIGWSPFKRYLFADSQIKGPSDVHIVYNVQRVNKVLRLLFGGGMGEAKRQQFFLDCPRDCVLNLST